MARPSKRSSSLKGMGREQLEQMENDESDGDQMSGTFARASEQQLKKRKRLKLKRGAVKAPPKNAPAPNAFSGISLFSSSASAGSSGGMDAPKRVSFAMTTGATSAPTVKPAQAAGGPPSGDRMRRLNASFLHWIKAQSVKNPAADWSTACRQYCQFAAEVGSDRSSAAAPASSGLGVLPLVPATPSSFFSAASSPFKAPAPAPTPAPTPAPAAAPSPAPAASSGDGAADHGGSGDDGVQGTGKKQVEGEEVLYEVRAQLYKWKRGSTSKGGDGAEKKEEARWANFGADQLRIKRDATSDKRWMHMANKMGKTVLNVPLYAALKLAPEGPTTVSFVGPDVEGGMTKHMLRVKTAPMLAELKEVFEKHKPKA